MPCQIINQKKSLSQYFQNEVPQDKFPFRLVGILWHIKPCESFNAKSCLYIYWKRPEADDTPHKLLRTRITLMTVLLSNPPALTEFLLHSLEKAAGGIGLHVNADKIEYMYFNQNQREDISILTGGSFKLVDKFTYLGSSVLIYRKWHQYVTSEGMVSCW